MRARFHTFRREIARRDAALAAALSVFAAWLRLRGLGTHWLNPDEGLHAAIAARPWPGFVEGLLDNAHPPLYFALLRGVAAVTDAPELLRAPSAVFGALAVMGIFLATRRAFGSAAGLLAAALMAVSPGAIALSQLVRPYALQLAALCIALWTLARFLDDGRPRDLALYATCLGAALLTHYGSGPFLVAASLGLAAFLLADPRGRLLARSRGPALLLVHLAGLALLLALYTAHFHAHLDDTRLAPELDAWLAPYLPGSAVELWLSGVGLQRYLFGPRHDGLATLLLGLGLVASLRGRARPFALLALTALALGAALGTSGRYPFGGTRHATWLFPLLVPLVAEGVRVALSGPPWRATAGAAALALLWLFPALPDRAVGAARQRVGEQVERLATREEVAALEAPLRALRERPARVLTDEQTWYYLHPFLRDARPLADAEPGRPYRRLAWGATELVVARAWQLRGEAREIGAPDHVVGLLRRLGPARPGAERESWLLAGGWGPLPFPGLAAFERALPQDGDASFALELAGGRSAGLMRFAPTSLLAAAERVERSGGGS